MDTDNRLDISQTPFFTSTVYIPFAVDTLFPLSFSFSALFCFRVNLFRIRRGSDRFLSAFFRDLCGSFTI